jgi:hypothetical protein
MGRTRSIRSTKASPAAKAAQSVSKKYKKKSPFKGERVRRALYDVKTKKVSITQSAKSHGLSYGFLWRRIFGEVEIESRNGPPTVFSREEEEAMANYLSEMAERGMGLMPNEFLDFVESVVKREKRKTPFKDNRPS